MFIVLPTGHSASIRRIPWATASIVLLCVLVQMASTAFGHHEQVARIETELHELKASSKREAPSFDATAMLAATGLVPAAPKLPKDPKARAKLRSRLGRQLRDLESKDPARMLAYRFGTGLSIKLLTSAFADRGWLHLLANMLFLYLCGCNLEDRWGRWAFVAFYLGGALVSAGFLALVHRHDQGVVWGATGAVAACMGAFLVFYARSEVSFFYAYWLSVRPKWGTFRAAAYWAVGAWAGLQVLSLLFKLKQTGGGYFAHLAGFVFGVGIALELRRLGWDEALLKATEEPPEWEEDPEVLRALTLLHAGRESEALAALKAVRARLPRHRGVAEELLDLGMRLADREAVEATASEILLGLVRDGEPVQALDRLDALQARLPGAALSDRALAALAKAAFELSRNGQGVDLTRRLWQSFPQSPVLPAALLEVGKAQLRAGRTALGCKTLERVIAQYPFDPFAEEARRVLQAATRASPEG